MRRCRADSACAAGVLWRRARRRRRAAGADDAYDVEAARRVSAAAACRPTIRCPTAKVELGRHLFYDTRLSGNGTQSCATLSPAGARVHRRPRPQRRLDRRRCTRAAA